MVDTFEAVGTEVDRMCKAVDTLSRELLKRFG